MFRKVEEIPVNSNSILCIHGNFKDTNRKIGKIEFIYICGSKNGSSNNTVNRTQVKRCETRAKGAVHDLIGFWIQNSNTVI